MKINEFLAEINMLPEAVHLLNELQESGRIGEEEYQENKLLYEKDRALFYEKILLEKDYRLVFLYYLCRMGAETYDAYEKRGISREIFRLLSVLPPEFGNDLAALILHGYGCEPAQTTHFRPHGNFPCAAPRLPSPTLSENLHRPFSLCQNQRRDTPPLLCISCFL